MEEDRRDAGLPGTVPASPTPLKRRRRYAPALKREMVEATLDGSESVSEVARRYDVNTNQLFKWRKLYHDGLLQPASMPSSAVLPITVAPPPSTGELEIVLSRGHRLLMRGSVDAASLRTVLELLR